MNKIKYLVFFGIISFIMCHHQSNLIEITLQQKDKEIKIKIDEKIIIRLPSNPTTGYSWENMTNNEEMVYEYKEQEYSENPDCHGRVGCGGYDLFYLKAKKSGKVKLFFIYKRPFETNIEDKFSLHLLISQ